MVSQTSRVEVVIATDADESTVFNAQSYSSFGIITPAALTSTAITFLVSGANDEEAVFVPLKKADGNAESITVAASGAYALPASLAVYPYFKLKFGTNEAADRVIVVVAKS